MANSVHDTPAMRQHRAFKEQHPDCVLFFRMGDFYELFYDDAKLAAKVLSLTLTQRANGIPMAGIPYHSLSTYLRRMIHAGHRVAICDQVEDPAQAKGVVKRDVTRLVTPGTLVDDSLLDEATQNPIAAVMFTSDDTASVAFAELSTGSFQIALFHADSLADELARINPGELLYVETADNQPPPRIKSLADAVNASPTPRPAWHFRHTEAHETLLKQFSVTTLKGFGIEDNDPVINPAGALISYLIETQCVDNQRLAHLRPPLRYEQSDYLIIDQTSLRSLEIERTMRTGELTGSLLGSLQNCRTPMGKRLLRHWLCYPLKKRDAIETRQNVVAAIVDDPQFSDNLIKQLDPVQDVQRISARIAVARCSPRDLVALAISLSSLNNLKKLLAQRPPLAQTNNILNSITPSLNQLADTLTKACVDSPPPHMRDGGLIRDGYDTQLDQYRQLQRDSNTWLADYQSSLTQQLNIPTLKVGYNKVFGYYIEVTHTHTNKIPDNFTRKQTLKNAERYITPQLKEYEHKVLNATQKAVSREQYLFQILCQTASDSLEQLQIFATAIAELDVLSCFARHALRYRYTRPCIVDEPILDITQGRHPVLDQLLADRFVPNDINLRSSDNPNATLAVITGPNMAGKSTYIRQAALLTLMAHTGSFIPATNATIGLTDRVFTRVGAADELHSGLSTFMVEMTETANICHKATQRSLVILDEVGRGTSTLDGLSLAWAITEFLAKTNCRTLFATHYHELVELSQRFDNVINLNVTVREWAEQVVFLHQIANGGTDKSFGIHVAKIAGLPDNVIQRARQLMAQLDTNTHKLNTNNLTTNSPDPTSQPNQQLTLFTQYLEHPAITQLRDTDINSLSPLKAFDILRQIKHELENQQ